jgi:hypothetical protein
MKYPDKRIIKIAGKDLLFKENSNNKYIKFDVLLDSYKIGQLVLSPIIKFEYQNSLIAHIENIYDIINEIIYDTCGILFELLGFEYFVVFKTDMDDNLLDFKITYEYDLNSLTHLMGNVYVVKELISENNYEYVLFSYNIEDDILKFPILNRGKNFKIVFNYLEKKFGEKFVKRLEELNLENMI